MKILFGSNMSLKSILAFFNRPKVCMSDFVNHDLTAPQLDDPESFESLFWNHNGSIVHKWHHYLPIYDRHLKVFKNRPLRFLEIGVSKGGSLSMWRKYFGQDAIIYGVDIDPNCMRYDGLDAQVRIGSQDNEQFISKVIEEMGGVDIVLDDGSHVSKHIRSTFNVAFPKLSDGGLYIVEDLHAAYWRSHGGGYQSSKSFISDISQMYDDMHHWYHSNGQKVSATRDSLSGIHLYDSLAIFEKNKISPPRHSKIGSEQ